MVLPFPLVFYLAAASSSYAQKPALNVTFPRASGTSHVVLDNFIGVSYELSSFDTLWGKTANTLPNPMLNYMSNLRARISNPLRIRVGGNGMDGSTYVPAMNDKMLELTDPNAYFNDIPVDFGPVLFDVMNSMVKQVGSMQFLIGLSMRDPDNDDNVLELANAAEKMLGDNLDAMLLGNEPDLYEGHGNRETYDLNANYIPEIAEVIEDFKVANLLGKPIIGGPTTCCRDDWSLDKVLNAGLNQFGYKYYTIQHYPNNACGGETPENTNISFYLSHTNIGEYINWNSLGVNAAKASNVPVLLTEYNSVSCGGSNISNTFAMSLWAIDAGLKAAASNFSAVYLHTREMGVKYNLFDPPQDSLNNPVLSNQTDWSTGSPYYAALFLAESISQFDGSAVVDLDINSSTVNPTASVAAYGIYDQGGTTRGKLALLNFNHDPSEDPSNLPADSTDSTAQVFRLPANISSVVRYRILRAPSVYSTADKISWAGQSVKDNGAFQAEQDQMTGSIDCGSGCEIKVPGPGAALVFFQEDLVYYGNSTIVGVGYLGGGDESMARKMATDGTTWIVVAVSMIVGWAVGCL